MKTTQTEPFAAVLSLSVLAVLLILYFSSALLPIAVSYDMILGNN
jgi:hypothetical protein